MPILRQWLKVLKCMSVIAVQNINSVHDFLHVLCHFAHMWVMLLTHGRIQSNGSQRCAVKLVVAVNCLLVFCRSSRIHWCFGFWTDHLLAALHFLAAGEEAQSYQLALLGFLGLCYCWHYHHSLWGDWGLAWHYH